MLDGEAYDLEQGTLFLVTANGGEVEVAQLDEELSTLTPTNEGVEAFGQNTPAIAKMMEEADGR